ncbi:MAG: type II secretion system protein [Holophagae bacterium]|jgi:general secretion pathway protein G
MKRETGPAHQAGFTIIELLIVVAVIGILVAVAIPDLIGAIQRSRQSRTVADIRMISEGIEAYQNDHSFYPLVDSGTVADLGEDLTIYIRRFNHVDGWREPIYYESDGHHYTVISFGADGSSTLPYTDGPTNRFEADIVFTDGSFLQWPEGQQVR